MPAQALTGFRDFFPDEFALRAHIQRVWREVAARYGFAEYDGPPLEPLELYTRKSGAEIVGQLYAFTDRGGREVALRPEMTPTLARMVAARANGLRKPIRWFAIPQLFRYERPQRGRLREHFQLNCDLIGEPGPGADAEMIALALDVMRAFGFGPQTIRARVSDRRVLAVLLRAGGVSEAQLTDAYQAVDRIERARREDLASQLHAAGLGGGAIERVFEVAGLRGREPIAAALHGVAGGIEAGAAFFRSLDLLDAMGLGGFVDPDLSIVRGLAYYTGTVFELFDAGRTLRAICGGGRYDTLLSALGGVDLPALGFGMGDVVLGELLREHGLAPASTVRPDAFVAGVTADDAGAVAELAHRLREAGLRVEYALALAPLGKQLRQAAAVDATVALVLGPDERARGEVVIRDLASGTQTAVPVADTVERVRSLMASRSTAVPPE